MRHLLVVLVVLVTMVFSGSASADEIVDFRMGFSRNGNEFRFFDYVRTGRDGTIEFLNIGGRGWSEVDFGLGEPIAHGKFNASAMLYLAQDDHGGKWVYPGLPYSFTFGQLSGEGFLYHYIPLNARSPHITGGTPVVGLSYNIHRKWSIGASMDAIKFEGENENRFNTKIGPTLRYGSPTRFLELRAAYSTTISSTELQFRFVKIF